ncbi:MAG TPA: hypothetical protein VKT82_12450 [Ktedonobacterales bacterium]|nr:hypothetical protein [Ktedonobacterales bacterium]
MDSAGSQSERFDAQPTEAQANSPAAGEASLSQPPANGAAAPPSPPSFEYAPLFSPSAPPEHLTPMAFEVTVPFPPLTAPLRSESVDLPTPTLEEETQPTPAASGSASVFRIDQERLTTLQDLNWRRVRLLLIVLAVGVALGLLLLIPAVHQPPPAPAANPLIHQPPGTHRPVSQRPLWATVLLVVSVVAPLLALALGLIVLPGLLWRAAWLRRQRDLHLAIGRQGLLFFLPGRAERWLLLPWGHITGLADATAAPRSARRERLRTVLWRRWARLRRLLRRGRRLGAAASGGSVVRSPFLAHARAAVPQERLRVACFARLPDSGYSWLFGLAPFTRRVGAATFLLETGWFESAISAPGVSLRRVLLGLWVSPLARSKRPVLPLPQTRGAVLLDTPDADQEPDPEARRVDGAAWAALLLVPALSVLLVAAPLVLHKPMGTGAALDLATLAALTLGLSLLLAGTRWPTRGRVYISGACALALAGALNVVYGLVVLVQQWPWSLQAAPGVPFFFLDALAGLLLLLGGSALALEGSGRPGQPSPGAWGADVGPSARPHSTELVVALGLLALGVARIVVDIDLGALSSGATTLQWLRYTLAEPLLPLAIIGLSYFALLAGPGLQTLFRALQVIYGLVLGLLVPAAFIFVYRAGGGKHPVPLEWLPLLIVALICGLLVVVFALLPRRQDFSAEEEEALDDAP